MIILEYLISARKRLFYGAIHDVMGIMCGFVECINLGFLNSAVQEVFEF
jgi:hypothetical protein